MKASNKFVEGERCCFCGEVMTPPTMQESNSFTIDHIYPKSHSKYNDIMRMQYCCKACNHLKGNHVPSATLNRIITACRQLELEIPELRPKNIESYVENDARRTYKVNFYEGLHIEIHSSLNEAEVFLDTEKSMGLFLLYQSNIENAISQILLRRLSGIQRNTFFEN